ncbi:MAG TPA: NUDIX domain-containing protein [Thermoanaerobaculia bacterium]|nr:NUDIX domain-containing protein [Thermoanaerobaculia bacterium]
MPRNDQLLAQLRVHAPADDAEARDLESLVNLLTTADDVFSRAHFAPGHVTASCYIVDPASERLLLHHHRRLDRWLQMGGHVEAGELPHEAALREGSEESGLGDLELIPIGQRIPAILDVDVHRIPAGRGEPDHDHFDVRYIARTAAPEAITIDRAESNELAWLPLDRAEALMNAPESTRVVRKIDRLLRERSLL